MDPSLPTSSHRLFAHYPDPHRLPDIAPEFVIARLFEEGDSRDLRWLIRRYPEERLAAWLQRKGARQLSHRSRSFWEIVLNRTASSPAARRGALWPL